MSLEGLAAFCRLLCNTFLNRHLHQEFAPSFELEALTLALFGGGLGLGLLGTYRIAQVTGWRILIRPEELVLAVGFAGAMGIIFGYYPAKRASRLDPVEALGR